MGDFSVTHKVKIQTTKPTVCFLLGGAEDGGTRVVIRQMITKINRDKFGLLVVCCKNGPFVTILENLGYHCDILGTGYPPQLSYIDKDGKTTKRRWLAHINILVWTVRTIFSLVRYIRYKQVDIVHTNYPHYHFISTIACKITKRKCVWHWHALRIQSGKLLRFFSGLICRFTSNFVWSIGVSQDTTNSVKPYAKDNLTLVYNGIEINKHIKKQNNLRKILNVLDNTRIIGLVGFLNRMKGHTIFVEAAGKVCSLFDDVHFVSVGGCQTPSQKEYLHLLLQMTKDMNLENKVHFLGRRDDVLELTAQFDIATIPTLPPGEAFGLVIIEAMSLSIPVIGTSIGSLPEIIEDGKTGILIPEPTSDALAEAIINLLNNEEKRQTIAKSGHDAYAKKFNVETTIKQIESVYEKVSKL